MTFCLAPLFLQNLLHPTEKRRETVEPLAREKSSIRVAEYLTELPPREVLAGKLHKVFEPAR